MQTMDSHEHKQWFQTNASTGSPVNVTKSWPRRPQSLRPHPTASVPKLVYKRKLNDAGTNRTLQSLLR